MLKINNNFFDINQKYLFSEIRQIIRQKKSKNIKLIDMSIGDISLPIDQNIIKALHKAVDEMGDINNFKGYSPDQGYIFLRESIKQKYLKLNIKLNLSEIFISDGSKSDLSNILEIFSDQNIVGIQSISYPVYYDSCKLGGYQICFIRSCKENNFLPSPEDIIGPKPDLIYLCSPNNPTGMAYNTEQLKNWVDFALKNNIIIFYDSAYQDFIKQKDIPYTIYQIKDAKNCAIEFCSFSKSAGFTGLRCGYTIFPDEIILKINNKNINLNKLWARRQSTKFNGVSYLSQVAANEFLKNNNNLKYIKHCDANSKKIIKYLDNNLKQKYWGGVNSPYIWLETKNNLKSKDYFKYLINNYNIITTPGIGFGKDAEGFVRISNFFNI